MEISQTLQTLDELLHRCKLAEAEQFLRDAVAQAQASGDTDTEKTLRNEQMGFYRDCGRFPEMLETAASARALFENASETETIPYATTLLNCANAYRAAGQYDAAFSAYDTVQHLYEKLLPPDDDRVAGFWNNLALLYQETEQWNESCRCLETALTLVRSKPNNEVRVAISSTNLAVSLLQLFQTERALELLREADRILAGCAPSDFHYSATLAGFGDAYWQKKEYQKAADSYEQALSEIELHMGAEQLL